MSCNCNKSNNTNISSFNSLSYRNSELRSQNLFVGSRRNASNNSCCSSLSQYVRNTERREVEFDNVPTRVFCGSGQIYCLSSGVGCSHSSCRNSGCSWGNNNCNCSSRENNNCSSGSCGNNNCSCGSRGNNNCSCGSRRNNNCSCGSRGNNNCSCGSRGNNNCSCGSRRNNNCSCCLCGNNNCACSSCGCNNSVMCESQPLFDPVGLPFWVGGYYNKGCNCCNETKNCSGE